MTLNISTISCSGLHIYIANPICISLDLGNYKASIRSAKMSSHASHQVTKLAAEQHKSSDLPLACADLAKGGFGLHQAVLQGLPSLC